jgi:hypothetical protein
MRTFARITLMGFVVLAAALMPFRHSSAQHTPNSTLSKEEGLPWRKLHAQQRSALGPLQAQWVDLSANTKEKWLAVAQRMESMRPSDRQRIQSRMTQWASLSPQERGQTRLQFNEARRVAATTRAEQWKRYNELSDADRQQLASIAVPASPTEPIAAVRHSKPSFLIGEPRTPGKVNTTPASTSGPVKVLTPAVVQARAGATTTLISTPPSPPAHQPAGQPKIGLALNPKAPARGGQLGRSEPPGNSNLPSPP